MLKRNAPSSRKKLPAKKKRKVQDNPLFEPTAKLGIERKFLDTAIVDTDISATVSKHNLCIIPQNDTASGRDGRKIVIKSIHIKGTVTLNAPTLPASTSNVVKITILKDTQTNKAEFASTDWLAADAIQGFANLANNKRFKVLATHYCEQVSKAGGATNEYGEDVCWVEKYLNCNIPIEYDSTATTGVVETQTQNSIWLVFQASTGERSSITFRTRIRYTDA